MPFTLSGLGYVHQYVYVPEGMGDAKDEVKKPRDESIPYAVKGWSARMNEPWLLYAQRERTSPFSHTAESPSLCI